MAAMAYAEFVVSVSRLLVLLMTSYPFAFRLGIHNTDVTVISSALLTLTILAVLSLLDQF
jgi:hypothetical protein